MKRILYITYDSINAAISQSQIIPLLNSYSKKNKLFLISFEKEKKNYTKLRSKYNSYSVKI